MKNSIGNEGEENTENPRLSKNLSKNVLEAKDNDYGLKTNVILKESFTYKDGTPFCCKDITDKHPHVSKQLFRHVMDNLVMEGVARKILHNNRSTKPQFYKIIKPQVKLFSYSKTTKTEYMGSHHLYITIPRIPSPEVKLPSGFWDKVNDRLKNNVQKFKRMEIKDYSLSIRQTNHKVIIQSNEPVMLEDLNDLTVICLGFVWELWGMLLDYDYKIDPSNAKVEDPEMFYTNGTVDHIARSHPNPKLRIYLDGVREKILASDLPKQKWVQFCLTPKFRGMHWIESNDKRTLIDWKNLPSVIAQQNQGFNDLKDMMGGMVYRDTLRFNMEVKITNAIEKIEKTLSVLGGSISVKTKKARKIIRPLNWWLR